MTTNARFCALLGGGTVLLLGMATAGPEPAGFWVPRGFVAQADTLIEQSRLELRCADQDSVVVSFPAGSGEEAFYNLSWLRADVRAFNSSPDASRSPFLIEGCRLRGVDPYYHRIDLPFNRLPRWRGDVRFTFDGLTSTLEGGRNQRLEIRHPVDGADASQSARVSLDERNARAHTPLLQVRRPSSPEVLADIFYVGDAPVLAERIDVGTAERVRVNGFHVPPGRLLRIESGDWLEFDLGGRDGARTYLAETGERARSASFVRVHDDQVDRIYPAPRLRPLIEPFGQAMDIALQTIPGGGDARAEIVNADVRLTIDRELESRLESTVADWCAERKHPTRPRAVSLLVMDAFTGAVRALPSCPGEEELAPYEPLTTRTRERFRRNQNLVPHPIGSAGKPFWAAAVASTFPNFLDLEIGGHPSGATPTALGCPLRFPYNDTHGSDARVGLEQFLERSCNRYLIEYVTAALAVGSGPGRSICTSALPASRIHECFPSLSTADTRAVDAGPSTRDDDSRGTLRFCDRLINTVLSTDLEAVGESCADLKLVDSKFTPAPAFSGLTNVATYRDMSPASGGGASRSGLNDRYRAERYRVDAWRHVLDALRGAGDTADVVRTSLRFSAVSPQATNLALNTVEELRTDWVNLLLGGENSRWTNFELAEALARMMTGRAVTGELADSAGDARVEPEVFDVLPENVLKPGVRRRVLHAMELVAGSNGTARRLAPRIADLERRVAAIDPAHPYDLYVFAKTGTPAVEKFLPSAQQRLVRQAFEEGDIRWDDATNRFAWRNGAREKLRRRYGDRTLRWIDVDVLQPMQSSPRDFTAAVNAPLPEHPLYFDVRGRLRAREITDLRIDRQGGVLILGFLAVPRTTGRAAAARVGDWISACTLDPGLRERILEIPPVDMLDAKAAVGLTAAIYLDDLSAGQGSGYAVDLAGTAMESIARYIEREIRRRLTGS